MDTNSINFRLPKQLREKLERASKALNIDISEFLRDIIQKTLSDEKNISYMQESINQMALEAEKLSIEAKNLIEQEIKKHEDEIRGLAEKLNNINQDYGKISSTLDEMDKIIDEHMGITKFLREIKTIPEGSMFRFYQDLLKNIPELEKVSKINYNAFKKYLLLKKQQGNGENHE